MLAKKELKARAAYQVARLLKLLTPEFDTFNTERDKLINKYCVKNENGEPVLDDKKMYTIAPEDVSKFNSELDELMGVSVELNVDPLNLFDLEEITFTPTEMYQLNPFIKFE